MNFSSFYHSLSRFWELSFGGFIYAITTKLRNFKQVSRFQWIIFILFIFSIGYSQGNTTFNVIKTLFLVINTGFLILIITSQPNHKIVSTPFLVFLGLISYPLYLWHYVFISYIHIFGLEIHKYGLWVALFSVFISYLTYRYVEIYARKADGYGFAVFLFVVVLMVGLLGQYIYCRAGLQNRSHLISNDIFQKQFIRTPGKNKLGLSIVSKILGYEPTNNYVKATSDDLSKKFVLILGDSHAHTSYPGFAKEFMKMGYEVLLLANSSCPPYVSGAMGKDFSDVIKCKNKIKNFRTVINGIPGLEKVLFITRGPCYIYDIGYGVVDGGEKPSNYHFEEFFINSTAYNQKEKFFEVVERTFKQYNDNNKFDFYYLLEDPELGFSPKNCMERPFGLFPTQCKINYKDYMARAGEYRRMILKFAEKYQNIHILDPKNLYCDGSYCYAVKGNKMLYADDDHHSVDGSYLQAEYFIKEIMHDF